MTVFFQIDVVAVTHPTLFILKVLDGDGWGSIDFWKTKIWLSENVSDGEVPVLGFRECAMPLHYYYYSDFGVVLPVRGPIYDPNRTVQSFTKDNQY